MKDIGRLEKSDKCIVAIAMFCALLLFSWLVYDIAFLNPLLEGQVEIGKIYSAKNRVKRKFNKSLIWYAAQENEIVYENDWIFTGSQSIAKIKLNSGGEIIIEPDSLIILSRKNGVLQLDLQHGRLMADVKDNKKIKINIVRDGTVQTVDTSQRIVRVEQKEDPLEDPIVESLDLDVDQDGSEDQTISEFADQQYYVPQKGFQAIEDNGLSLQEQDRYDFKLFKGQSASVELFWQDPFVRWLNYEIEFSESADFAKILTKGSGENSSYKGVYNNTSRLFWRVRGIDDKGKPSSWSKPKNLLVNIEWKEKAKALQLSREKYLYQMEKSDLEKVKPDRSYEVAKTKPINIEWDGNKEAAAYRVEISNKPDFSNIIEQKIVEENKVDLSNIHLGKTFFRVIPESKEGIPLAKEARGEVTTYFPAPPDQSLKTVDNDTYQTLKWDQVPYAEAYQVTYKLSKTSDEEIVEYVKDNKLNVENKTGYLEWKVRVVDPKSKKWMSSNSTTVDWYDAAKRLASLHGTGQAGRLYPKILRPEPRKTFISVNNSPLFIVMSWKYEDEAKAYEVEISKNADMRNLVYKKRVKRHRAVINQKFAPGIYFMRVRAVKEDITQEAWSETETFRVINRRAR